MQPDPRDNFRREKGKVTFGAWLWTCIKICILIVMMPIALCAVAFLATVFFPIIFIAVPIMILAFVWLLLS